MEERHLSLSEVAGAMGVSERTVHRWIKSGKLKSYKPGRDHRIPESGLREFIEESEVYPKGLEPPLPFEGQDERRKDKYLPWLEFAERYADRWREKVEQGALDRGALNEWRDTMHDLGPIMSRLWREEERDASPEQLRSRGMRGEDDNLVMWKAVSQTLGLLEVVLPAAQKLFEESEFAEFKRERERLEKEWRRAASG